MSAKLVDAALDYAARGWLVLALWGVVDGRCACEKADCGSPGKHPIGELMPHGLKDATTDPDVIRGWWKRHPSANVGLRTGIAFDVLDVDGDEGLEHLEAAGCFRDPYAWDGPEVITSAGFHRYLLPSGAGNRAGIVPKVDYRGVDGYVVASPSLHVLGVRYCWGIGGPDVPLEPMPAWLAELMAPKPMSRLPAAESSPRGGNWSGLIAKVATAVEGERNSTLHWSACRVGEDHRRGKLTADQVSRALDELLIVAQRIGLAEREARATIQSGYSAGSGRVAS